MGFTRNWRNKNREFLATPYVEQWHRIQRWHERLAILNRQLPRVDPNDLMDHVYACLQNCYMLRDWLLGCGIDRKKIDDVFGSPELKLCRDVANGTKHFEITKPSIDAGFLTVCEYVPPPVDEATGGSYKLTLCANGRYYSLTELCTECVDQIRGFIEATTQNA